MGSTLQYNKHSGGSSHPKGTRGLRDKPLGADGTLHARAPLIREERQRTGGGRAPPRIVWSTGGVSRGLGASFQFIPHKTGIRSERQSYLPSGGR